MQVCDYPGLCVCIGVFDDLLRPTTGIYGKKDCSYQGNALNVPIVKELVSNSFWLMKY